MKVYSSRSLAEHQDKKQTYKNLIHYQSLITHWFIFTCDFIHCEFFFFFLQTIMVKYFFLSPETYKINYLSSVPVACLPRPYLSLWKGYLLLSLRIKVPRVLNFYFLSLILCMWDPHLNLTLCNIPLKWACVRIPS